VRPGRFIRAGVAAATALAIAPAAAAAATLEDSGAGFGAGTGTGTWVVEPGVVRLKPAVGANFDGAALPSGFELVNEPPWDGGTAVVAAGAVTVNGARVNTVATYTAPRVLELRATFGDAPFQHVGFGETLEAEPWAHFSTGTWSLPVGLYARTARPGTEPRNVPVPNVDPRRPHTYRIEWSATDVRFYVDGTPVGTPHRFGTVDWMRPIVSDLSSDDAELEVDWLALSPYPRTGAFVSRVHDGGHPRTVWGALTADASGGVVRFETRSGRTASPGAGWSGWRATGAGGAIESPPGRYIQYRATLAAGDGRISPTLRRVELDHEADTAAPAATIAGVRMSGRVATVTFSSAAADVERFECSLDGGGFASCTSPQAFSGLAPGAHGVVVRAVDRAGNTGPTVATAFTMRPPAARDESAPAVTVTPTSVRASKRGKVRLRVRCPRAEVRCKVKLTLKRGGATVARTRVTVTGGVSRWATLGLDAVTRARLAARRRLKATAVITAVDAAGNRRRSARAITLRAA